MTIAELLRLRNKLGKEKRIIDRKISIINNLVNTSQFLANRQSVLRRKRTYESSE